MTCPHYQECGGCDFRDLPYCEQLAYKQRYVHNLLAPFSPSLETVIASPVQDHYRNKMEFVVARAGGEVRIGQRRKNCFNAVVDIDACPIFHPRAGEICARVKKWVVERGCPVYDLQKGGQGLRYITLRHAKAGDELMVTITSAGALPQAEGFAAELVAGGVAASVYLCVNDAASDRAVAGELRCVAGAEFIRETVNGVSYRIYPQTFFQTNPFCCAPLYSAVRQCLQEGKAERQSGMIDLFCGSGGIGLQLAAAGFSVTGIDNVEENCRCARANAADNSLGNAQFVCRDAQTYLEEMHATGALKEIGGLVVDPPRQGLTKRSRAMLAGSGIPLIVYVSCNPLTLAQDLKALSASYRVEKCIPVDMCPPPRHSEPIVKLNARAGSHHGENRPYSFLKFGDGFNRGENRPWLTNKGNTGTIKFMKHIVILGSSVAGHTLAVALRQQDSEAKITLVSEENFVFYDRRRLLEYVVGDVKEKDMFLVAPDFYEKNGIVFLKQHSVLHVSPSRKQVSLRYKEKREVLAYDQLAVCTGRRTQLPDIDGINKEGVYTVDSLTDCRQLRQHLISDPVCLIGSSPCASRFAQLLAAKQREVKEFALPGEVVEFIGEGGVQALKLKEGKIIGTSLPVVFSSPAKANMDFLKESDIETAQGSIVVDDQQRTNLPGIFASGSVCRRIDRTAGDKTWEEAETESRQLAAVMLGAAAVKAEA